MRGLGLLLAAGALLLSFAPPAEADHGIESFRARTTDAAEDPYTLAGGHPYQSIIAFSMPSGEATPVESLNRFYFSPPPGLIGNPSAAPRCPIGDLRMDAGGNDVSTCPSASRVGVIDVMSSSGSTTRLLYNLVSEAGYPAQFGFLPLKGSPEILSVVPRPRTDSYGLTFARPSGFLGSEVSAFSARLCGFGATDHFECKSPSELPQVPFLSNPVDCSEAAPTWTIALDTLEHAGVLREPGVPDLSDPNWMTAGDLAPPVSGCDDPLLGDQFEPTILAKPLQGGGAVQADQPSGFAIDVDFPQSNDPTDSHSDIDPEAPQAPAPRNITAKLPPGLAISPAAADGLGACSDRASDPAGDQVHYENTEPVTCPDSAKIGGATATSPLLAAHHPVTGEVIGAEPISGDVYVLKPHPGDLPPGGGSDGKFRFLIELENRRYGVNVKLPGTAIADRQTGQITTLVTDSPQLPASHLTITLWDGPRAPLMTPVACGSYDISTTMVPWSAPGTPDAHPTASFDVESGPGGGGCHGTRGQRPFAPTLGPTGSISGRAGAASPFTFAISRPDGDQELSSLAFTAPPGLAAALKGVASCPEAAIATARDRSGSDEEADPSCPPASQVGTLSVGAGSGPNPYHAEGRAYLAGPYMGAPFSFAFITPARAGAFDLGTIVFRAAAFVDPSSAQVRIKAEKLPRILEGIPVRLRSVAIRLDRPGFTRNPTNCQPTSVSARVEGSDGGTASPRTFFRVGDCAALPFRPRVSAGLAGALARHGRPALRAVITAKPGQANIARAALTLPVTELLDYDHIRAVCTKSRYAAGEGGGEACAPASRYGRVRLFTPLLDEPLEGPLYLRANGNPRELPDLVASLDGDIHLDLVAQITSAKGLLRVVFDDIPDFPVKKVVVRLQGGRRGLLVNTTDLCPARAWTSASFLAHNGKRRNSRSAVKLNCAAVPSRSR